jgi:hypothetical protein
MRLALPAILLALTGLLHGAEPATAANFAAATWVPERWNKSEGTLDLTGEAPPKLSHSATVTVSFKGSGYEWFVINPVPDITLPKGTTVVTMWVKGGQPGYPFVVKFKDAKETKAIDGKDMEWDIHDAAADAWQQRTFDIPPGWTQPVSIYAIAFHNWDHQNDAKAVTYQVAGITWK